MMDGIERCGADYCFTMTDEDASDAVQAAQEAPHITRPSGSPTDPAQARNGGGYGIDLRARELAAARKLSRLWRGSLVLVRPPMGYGDAGRAGGATLSKEEAEEAQVCWDSYCAAMNEMARCCSYPHARAVRAVVVYEEKPERAYLVREGLGWLADFWGVR